MNKSFKKAIAVILTVLMVVTSFPFTALADYEAVKNYHPDFRLQFGTYYPANDVNYEAFATSWQDYTTVANSNADFTMTGLNNVPVDYDYTINKETGGVSGNLYIDAAKAAAANDSLGLGYTLDGNNIEFGTGDFFTVTAMIDNIDRLMTAEFILQYSDNIEPACFYSVTRRVGNRNQVTYKVGTVAEYEAATGTAKSIKHGGTDYIGTQSLVELYNTSGGMSLNPAQHNTSLDTTNRLIKANMSPNMDVVPELKNSSFVDPATGSCPTIWDETTYEPSNEYAYNNCVIVATYAFKITDGSKPISFDVYDPDNSKLGTLGGTAGFSGAYYKGAMDDGVGDKYSVTYADNCVDNNGQKNYGSNNFTFMGYNCNVGDAQPTCEHANTTTDVTSTADCLNAGVETTTVTCNDCGEVVSTTTKDVPALGHDMTKEVTAAKAATCTEAGNEAQMGCTRCDVVADLVTIDALGHDMTKVVTAAKDPTCTAAGNEVQMGCTRCDVVDELKTIAATGHQNYTAASNNDGATHKMTCTAGDDSYDENCTFGEWVIDKAPAYQVEGSRHKTCTVCGQTVTETLPATDCEHNGATHEVLTKTDAATCTDKGTEYYDVVCDICNNTISTTTKEIAALGHDMTKVVTAAKAATCTEAGNEEQLGCTRCDVVNELVTIDALGHDMTKVVTAAKAATCTEAGNEEQLGCTRCDVVADLVTIDALGHDMTKVVTAAKAATCTEAGNEAQMGCTRCDVVADLVTIDALGHDMTKVVTAAKAATCTEAGNEEQLGCTRCDVVNELVTIDALGHTPVSADNAVASTCTVAGKEADTICSVCKTTLEEGAALPLADHTAGDPETTTVDATFDAPGSITVVTKCTECGAELSKNVTEIPQLVGYDVTVDATGLGYVTLAGKDATSGLTTKFVEGTKVTLTAEPVEGAKFVGWTVNGRTLISTAATYTATVLADITYTPVFELAGADTFTVQFVDAFGNVVKIYTDVTADTVASLEVPALPARPGYTATGWSVTDMSTITGSTIITAEYEKAETELYTVNVPEGAVVTVEGAEVQAPYEFPFDTKVTVSLPGTEAWTVDGNAVAYGDSFTFFVTADVTLTAAAGIEKTPAVAWVNRTVEETVVGGKTKAVFKATRTMTDDCKFVDAGFVYAASALTADKLTLDNVNGKSIRASYTKTASEQFSLTLGIGTQQGTLSAVAFLAYVDASGANQVVYTPVAQYTYR